MKNKERHLPKSSRRFLKSCKQQQEGSKVTSKDESVQSYQYESRVKAKVSRLPSELEMSVTLTEYYMQVSFS